MQTVSLSTEEARKRRRWFVIDVDGLVLGRAATRIAHVLRGKHNPMYTPHVDTGDFVVVINAHKIKLTGRKETNKIYHRHTGWVGGVVSLTASELREKNPVALLEHAVKGMLPKGPLGRAMFSKLKVYAHAQHPHEAQAPVPLASVGVNS